MRRTRSKEVSVREEDELAGPRRAAHARECVAVRGRELSLQCRTCSSSSRASAERARKRGSTAREPLEGTRSERTSPSPRSFCSSPIELSSALETLQRGRAQGRSRSMAQLGRGRGPTARQLSRFPSRRPLGLFLAALQLRHIYILAPHYRRSEHNVLRPDDDVSAVLGTVGKLDREVLLVARQRLTHVCRRA